MSILIGIDLGTSSVKVEAMSIEDKRVALSSNTYKINIPANGFAEQNPEDWWGAAVDALIKVKNGIRAAKAGDVKGIGLSGQMHGLVLLDKDMKVIRPAIIWCDQRSQKQVSEIYKKLGKDTFNRITLNPLNTGFLIASLLWVKENEKENYKKIHKVLMPKDYIRFRLTGNIGTDYSDASGSLAFDITKGRWSEDILNAIGIDKDIFPPCSNSFEIAGTLTASAAYAAGLKEGIPIVYGGGDQQMQALGNGLISSGMASVTIGTGGQVYTPVDAPVYDKAHRLHTFCSAMPEMWCLMGASLSAGLSLSWLSENILDGMDFNTFNAEAEKITAGSDGVIFLPYLVGERTPHMDPNAKAMFFGLTLKHNRANLIRAVMEGVAFSLKESLDIMNQNQITIKRIVASGGGAKSKLWRQIQADIFKTEVYTTNVTEQACNGAIIAAGVAVSIYKSVQEAISDLVDFDKAVTCPNPNNVSIYRDYYGIYKELYKKNKLLFRKIN
jgi:xylulokinase